MTFDNGYSADIKTYSSYRICFAGFSCDFSTHFHIITRWAHLLRCITFPFNTCCFQQIGGRGFPQYLWSISAAPWPDTWPALPSGMAWGRVCQDQLEPDCCRSTRWNVSFILASPLLLKIQNDNIMNAVRCRACDTLMHNCYPLRLSAEWLRSIEGGQMVPSRTYIKEGLWNGDKCAQPCQTVCGSRSFWTCSTFGHVRWDLDTSSRQNEAGSFQSIITRCFVPFFSPQDGRPENHITRPTISKDENKGFLWEMQKSFNSFSD